MLYDILEAIFYVVFFGFKRRKRRRDEWQGVLVKKKTKGKRVLSKYNGLVIFRTGDDRVIKLTVSEEDLDNYELNKHYQKRRGEDFPVLVG